MLFSDLFIRYDVDETGELNAREFQKLVSGLRRREMKDGIVYYIIV